MKREYDTRFIELMGNEAFASELVKQESAEAVCELFAKNGIEIDASDVAEIKKQILQFVDEDKEALDEEDLETVSGGRIGGGGCIPKIKMIPKSVILLIKVDATLKTFKKLLNW